MSLACISAKDNDEEARREQAGKGHKVDDSVKNAVASLITCLIVRSRMALVAMLLMSGLWPRLLAARVDNTARMEQNEPKKKRWTLEDWQAHLNRL